VLGEVSVHTADGNPVPITRTSAVDLLTVLAVHRTAAAEDIMETLWPDVRRYAAVDRLHTAVSALRRPLRDAAGTNVLLRTGDRYRLQPTTVRVDLWEFHAAADRAAAADPAQRRAALYEVVDRYTGELATGRTGSWLHAAREAARRLVIDALAFLAADEDPDTALALLQTAIGHDPYNEELHRQVMRLQAAAGDTTGVQHTLHRLTRHLADLPATPGPQTQRLADDLAPMQH
jgi:DNA-binding SARP family transcriptional activator